MIENFLTVRRSINNSSLRLKHRFAEVWLDQAVEYFKPIFMKGGYQIPPIALSVGFADDGYKPHRKSNTAAICYAKQCSAEGINQIIITPLRTEPLDIIWLLCHELIHAVDDCVHGHGAVFHEIAYSVGYWPCKKSTMKEMIQFEELSIDIASKLGRYPRAPFVFDI
jgi:hypothetical protein